MIQMQDPIETAELLAFARAVESKSLSRAAAELGVPRATLGRRLARLEERLRTRLLRRTTRSLTLTDAGELFYRQARIVLDAVAQAQASVRRSDDVMRGDVRVSVPPLDDDSFRAMVTAFAAKHPQVRVQIDFSTRMVDLLREGYDVALRASPDIEPGLVARWIGRHRAIAVASPSYLAEHGTPRSIKDLRKHRCVTGFARGELPQSTWTIGRSVVRVESVFSSNDIRLQRDAALRGLGIALLPEVVLGDLVERGALVQVLPGVLAADRNLAVVFAEREFLPPQVRAFVEALVEWARAFWFPEKRRTAKRKPATRGASPRARSA